MVSARCEAPGVREVEILSDEEPSGVLRCTPNESVVLTSHPFVRHRVDLVSQSAQHVNQTGRQVLVELNLTPRVRSRRAGLPGRTPPRTRWLRGCPPGRASGSP